MDAAKNAINKLTSGHGKHTTDVTEHYNPAVTHEQINPTREDEVTKVTDREVHQDHHHTSVLPVSHTETLPTEHSHQIAAAKHSEHHHGDHGGIRAKVAAEAERFQDQTQTAETQRTSTVAPSVGSEHHHHHVHETIQPIVQKQTIQPSVVHTTVPVHEVHHNEPKHYTASALPAVSLADFKSQGGSLTGIADRTERFEGEPDSIAKQGLHSQSGASASTTGDSTSQGLSNTTHSGTGTSGLTDTSRSTQSGVSSSGLNDTSRSTAAGNSSAFSGTGQSGVTGTGSTLHDSTSRTGTSTLGSGNEHSRAQQAIDSRVDRPTGSSNTTGAYGTSSTGNTHTSNTTSSTTGNSKPSLLDKLNPFKDTDGDGKKGMMS